jgi:hypothetical protein
MRPLHQYTDGGLRNVWLVNGYELKQTPFGEGVVIHDLDGLTKVPLHPQRWLRARLRVSPRTMLHQRITPKRTQSGGRDAGNAMPPRKKPK